MATESTDKSPTVRLTLRIPAEFHTPLKRAATHRHRNATSLMVEIVDHWLTAHGYLPGAR